MSGVNRLDGSFIHHILASQQDTEKGSVALYDLSERDKPWNVHRSESEQIECLHKETDFLRYSDRIHFCSEFLDFILAPKDNG